jgi:L-aspartate oxidase
MTKDKKDKKKKLSSEGTTTREKLLARKKKLAEKGTGNGFVFPKNGTTRLRIVSAGANEEFGMEIIRFYLGDHSVYSPATFNEACPFMEKYDERLSLAPRDIVARAIDKEMKIHGLDHVCLDVTHKPAEETRKHFPNIYHKCLTIGIDITTDYIPVRPAAHYMCGGIKVDLNGCSSISRLYAIGECSCTGLHGGNRLASNSLIEAVVYAETAARHSLAHVDEYDFNTLVPEWNDEGTMTNEEKVLITQSVKEVGEIMANYVGIVRSNLRLQRAWTRLDVLYEETEKLFKRVKATRDICELRNMINTAYLITRWAIERKECRGLHYTTDYPHK